MLINQNHGFVDVHHRTRTKESAQVHQTFFSLEVGSGNETVLHTDIEKKKWDDPGNEATTHHPL